MRMMQSPSASVLVSPLSPEDRSDKKFTWQYPRMTEIKRPRVGGHKISFSNSSKSSQEHPSGPSDSSRPSSPVPKSQPKPSTKIWPARQELNRTQSETAIPKNGDLSRRLSESQVQTLAQLAKRTQKPNCQHMNQQGEALSQYDRPPPAAAPDLQFSRESLLFPTSPAPKPFLIYQDSFLPLLHPTPTLSLLIHDARAPYFQSGAIFLPKTNTLFVISGLIPDSRPDAAPSKNRTIQISKVEFFSPKSSSSDFSRDKVRCPDRNYMPSSGTNFRDGLVLCAQGTLKEPAGLIYMEAKPPHRTTTLLNSFHGRPFNSPADAAVAQDGSIWFTDPIYGYIKGFRPKPQLPSQVYRFDPTTGDLRVVADCFGRPKGICFSPDEGTVYITDTDSDRGEGSNNPTRAATIIAYSVIFPSTSSPSSPFLTNRRVFAYADTGVPNCVACDRAGNVYAGCGDGIHVWNSGGTLIGKILVDGGCAGFCFGKKGDIWAMGGEKLWRVQMDEKVRGTVGDSRGKGQ